MGAQPIRKITKQEHFAQRNAQFEQTQMMQWHTHTMGILPNKVRHEFYRFIVRNQCSHPAIGDPLLQAFIEAIQARTAVWIKWRGGIGILGQQSSISTVMPASSPLRT